MRSSCRSSARARENTGNPEATAAAFTDGWLRTGAIGRQDADGFYYVDDRKSDVVISGGENICCRTSKSAEF